MKKIYTQVFAFIVLALPICTVAQVSTPVNFGLPTDFVGWNGNPVNNFPLQIRHDAANQPIDFFTGGNAVANFRMRINGNGVGAFANATIDASGHVGIGVSPLSPLSQV